MFNNSENNAPKIFNNIDKSAPFFGTSNNVEMKYCQANNPKAKRMKADIISIGLRYVTYLVVFGIY